MNYTIRAHHVADAFQKAARVNHYLVGVVGTLTREELEQAKQILISEQNAGPQKGKVYLDLDRALDMIEDALKQMARNGRDTWQNGNSLVP